MLPIRLMGPLSRETGYAVGFRGMLKHLVEKDVSIDLRPTKGVVPQETEQWILDLIGCKNYDRFGVAVGFPTLTDVLGTRRKVCYSMYESTDIPFGWKSNVAQAHEVWVPTQFCMKLFKPYNDHVRLVRWGIDDEVFKPGERTPHKGYVFGAVGVQSPRKGTDVMVRSFTKAFGGNPDVKLIIKTRDTRSLPPIDNEQITVIDEEWSEERLVQFYRDIDCLVESSRGEGVCALPGTKIKTDTATYTAIEDLSVGDLVVTHGNRFRPVTQTMTRHYCGSIYGIRRNYTQITDWYTEEHPIFVSRKKFDTNFQWVAAKDLRPTDYVAVPKAYTVSDIDSVKMCEADDGQSIVSNDLFGNDKAIVLGRNQHGSKWTATDKPSWNNVVELTPEMLKLMGLYVAEGCSGDNYISWSFHHNETDLQDHVKQTMNDAIGASSYHEIFADRNRYNIRYHIGIPSRFFGRLFGRKSHVKQIPECLMLLPPEKQKYLLLGMWLGDGSEGAEYSYSTVSEKLAYQVQEILRRCGVIATIKHRRKKVNRDEFSVRCKGMTADRFFNSIGLARNVGSQKPQETFWQDEDHFYVPIRSIEKLEYSGYVHNIEVEEDHSYCSQFVVHNCMPPLQAVFCGTPSIATLWGGPVDFADDKGVYGLRVKGLVPAKSMAHGSYWAEPDDRHLAQLMQWAVETRPGVSGDYSKWTSRNMANEFYQACVSSWRR